MSINTGQVPKEQPNLTFLETPLQTVESSAVNFEEISAEEEIRALKEDFAIGNIVGKVVNRVQTFWASEAKDVKPENGTPLVFNTLKNAPPSPQETVKPHRILPPSLRIDLLQFGELTEREQEAEKKYLSHFDDKERHFLKQQLGKIGLNFTTFQEYQVAEKLRRRFDDRLRDEDFPPTPKQLELINKEIDDLDKEIERLNNDINKLKKAINDINSATQKHSQKKARNNILKAKIDKLTKQIEPIQQQLEEKEKLLLEKQEQLKKIELWSPLTQLEKDNSRRNKIYRIPAAIEQLKTISTLKRELIELKRNSSKREQEIHNVAKKLWNLAWEVGNKDLMPQINKISLLLGQKKISPQAAIEGLEKLLSRTYQQHFLQDREAPRLYKKRNQDEILTAFKDKFGDKRYKEVFNDLKSFLNEALFLTYPLEMINQEEIRKKANVKGIELSEQKVSKFPFFLGPLLLTGTDEDNATIEELKASHSLSVDSYLKNRLPLALTHLLRTDWFSFAKLFLGEKIGPSQVKFFFGTLDQAVAKYQPKSIFKISGGGSEFYLFETYKDRKVTVINPKQKPEEEIVRFYTYHILIFDVTSIESLEHQLYQLRYANIPVLDMEIIGNVKEYTNQQVDSLALKAKEYLEDADKTYGRAMRVLLLGRTRLILTEVAQYLYPDMEKDEAFRALGVQHITPGPTFDLNYARVFIPNPGKKRIPVALLALRMPNGSLAGKVTSAMLQQAKVDYLITVGAGGSIDYKTPKGSCEFIDTSYIDVFEEKNKLSRRWVTDITSAFEKGQVLIPSNAALTTNITVSGPLLETGEWLENTKKYPVAISNVDVESAHILYAFNRASQEANVRPYITPALFISDRVGEQGASLSKVIGNEAYKDAPLLIQFIVEQIRKLHLASTSSLIPEPPSSERILETLTPYIPPGMQYSEVVKVPIAEISHIPFEEKNLGQIFKFINAVTINRPFHELATGANELPYFSKKTGLTAHRPNHNGTHSARQARLVEAALPLITEFGKPIMKQALRDLFSSPENLLALKLAAYCLRVGRCDERAWNLKGDKYTARSAEIFREYAQQLKIDPPIRELLAKYVRLATFDDDNAAIKNEEDRLVHAVLSLVHELDLVRLFPDKKFKDKVIKHLQTLLDENVNMEECANTLIQFSQYLSIATGGTLRNTKGILENEEQFTINSTDGDYCWNKVQRVPLPMNEKTTYNKSETGFIVKKIKKE